MSNYMQTKEKIKAQLLLVLLYCISEFIVATFLSILSKEYNMEAELDKVIIILGLIVVFLLMFVSVNKFKNRIAFCYFGMVECIVFSLTQLYAILNIHYQVYGRISFSILFIYMTVCIMLFIFNKNFYKKLSVEDSTKRKDSEEPNRVGIALLVICMLGITNYLGVNEKNAIYILLSLIISCGWLTLGWFLFQGTKANLNNLSDDANG